MCMKKIPKEFAEKTVMPEDGYPVYRRRDDGEYASMAGLGGRPCQLDNRYVVPYNPYLLLTYGCYINVELCNSIWAIKYLFKYVYKGPYCRDHADDPSVSARPRSMPSAALALPFPLHPRGHLLVAS